MPHPAGPIDRSIDGDTSVTDSQYLVSISESGGPVRTDRKKAKYNPTFVKGAVAAADSVIDKIRQFSRAYFHSTSLRDGLVFYRGQHAIAQIDKNAALALTLGATKQGCEVPGIKDDASDFVRCLTLDFSLF